MIYDCTAGITDLNFNCSSAVVVDEVLYRRERDHRGYAVTQPSMHVSLLINNR